MKVAVIMRHRITNDEDKVIFEVDAPSFRAFLTNEEILLKVLNDDEIKGRTMCGYFTIGIFAVKP
jgi:hypothetical protein